VYVFVAIAFSFVNIFTAKRPCQLDIMCLAQNSGHLQTPSTKYFGRFIIMRETFDAFLKSVL
jgi:hypothetical protein